MDGIKLLRPDQTADRLNVSKQTVYRLINAGEFTTLKVGGSLRVVESSIDRYIRAQIEKYFIENE